MIQDQTAALRCEAETLQMKSGNILTAIFKLVKHHLKLIRARKMSA